MATAGQACYIDNQLVGYFAVRLMAAHECRRHAMPHYIFLILGNDGDADFHVMYRNHRPPCGDW